MSEIVENALNDEEYNKSVEGLLKEIKEYKHNMNKDEFKQFIKVLNKYGFILDNNYYLMYNNKNIVKQYYNNNKDKIKEHQRDYYNKNKEEYKTKYYKYQKVEKRKPRTKKTKDDE